MPHAATRPDPRGDLALVDAHKAGDRTAFPALLARHRPMLERASRGFVRDRHAEEDVLQEAALRAWRGLETARFAHPAQLVTWLHRVARSTAVDTWRSAQCRPQTGPQLQDDDGAAVPDHADVIAHRMDLEVTVRTAVFQLQDAAQRDAVVRVHLLEQDVARVALETGAPEATVRTRLHRGRQKLRAILAGAA